MPSSDTPPASPSVANDDLDDEDQLFENDMVEVYELDGEESAEAAMGDGNSDGEGDDDTKEKDNIAEDDIIPEVDNAILTFSQHSEGILCCTFHPKSSIAASGGIDEMAHVWDTTNGNLLFSCKGHEDSIEVVSFSSDGSYLATADLKGVIQVWKINDFTLTATFELNDEFSWLQWHHGANVLIAASQIGLIYMYKLPSGENKMVLSPFGQICTAGKILADGKRLACGYKDGSLKVIDLKQTVVLQDIKPVGALGAITCLDVHKDNNLIVCGCEDGSVLLLSSQSGKVASVLNRSKGSDGCDYVEAVAFCKDPLYPVVASGSLDGTLIIWDITRQTLRHRHSFTSSVNQLVWDPSLPVLYTCHADGRARSFDAKAGVITAEFQGHRKCCLSIALSLDGSKLMTSSEDKTVRIFPV